MSPPTVVIGALMVLLLLVLAAGMAIWLLRRQLMLATVRGASMKPTFHGGERVLVRRRRLSQIRRGDVVVVEAHDVDYAFDKPVERQWNVKRVVALPGDPVPEGVPAPGQAVVPDEALVLFGDNREWSTDSRHYGFYSDAQLFGVVLRTLALKKD